MQVSFIIPVFNQLPLTQACLTSLRATLPAGIEHEIILVDDGSTDDTRAFLRELAPPHVVLLNDRNVGYATSNNRGARIARGKYLALLNNDLVLEADWLEPMLAAYAKIPNAGIVGNIQVAADSGEVDHSGVIFRDGGYPAHHREKVAISRARGTYVEFPGGVTAACCLVNREWFLRRGGFDEGYRNGFEDTDLCLRAREDGFINVVATESVVRHHISRSSGRHTHEYRNAQRFLSRWGPRTAALEREWELAEARRISLKAAQHFFARPAHRLGFGPVALRRRHRATLATERGVQIQSTRPVRIGIDLLRMQPGGQNGGVKPFVYSLLAEIARQRPSSFNFAVIAQPALREELTAFLRTGDFVLEPLDQHLVVIRRDAADWREAGQFALDDDVGAKARFDVLYAPFGVSTYSKPGLPWISFIVDLLHRELPAALPPEEVNHRDRCFVQIAREATYVQCNSRHVMDQLTSHYGVHASRCFTVYNAVQNRLSLPAPESTAPTGTPEAPFFFYPANFWPHKNHEALLVAYRLYAHGAGSRAWPLVFTGASSPRMKLLEEMRDGLGLEQRVHFLGHVDDAAFALLWSRAGALVFPSLHEGFGIPLLEAMRFGVSILASRTTSLPEVGGDACLYVDPLDPRAMADALRRIAIREGLRDDLIARGRVRLGAFSLELEASRLAHFLDAAARRQVP